MAVRVLVIGLTGGIASGKSTVAQLLLRRGANVIDADALAHEIYEPNQPAWRALVEEFGEEIVGAGGVIDRGKLGSLVFQDAPAMRRLTDIVWPLMKANMRRRLAHLQKEGAQIVVLEAAVLLEAGWEDLADEIWASVVPPKVAIERLMHRNNVSESQARARLDAQIGNEERVARAGVVIDNGGSPEDLVRQVDALWRQVLQRAA